MLALNSNNTEAYIDIVLSKSSYLQVQKVLLAAQEVPVNRIV